MSNVVEIFVKGPNASYDISKFFYELTLFVYLSRIYEIEKRVETPTLLRYPLFEAMHWYAGAHLLTMLRRHNEEIQVCAISDHIMIQYTHTTFSLCTQWRSKGCSAIVVR